MSEQEADDQQEAEASNPATSTQRFEELCTNPHLRIMVAGNPATPAHLLEQLSHDQDAQVRQRVAGNPNTPWTILEALAQEFPHAFLFNPAGSLQMLAHPERISTDDSFWGSLLREASLPPMWWNWLRSHPVLRESQAVHLHIQSAGETTHPDDGFHDEDEDVLLTLVELLTATVEQARERDPLGANTLSRQLVSLCQNSIKESLQRLAGGIDPQVRQAVAAHPHPPMEVLRTLAQDADPLVRKGVAEHPQAPVEVLRHLCFDSHERVRISAISHPHTPVDMLWTLAQDAAQDVRRAVAEHPHTPVEVLRILAQDAAAWVREGVAEHPHTPVEVLRILAQDAARGVRRDVAEHPHTPVEVLRTLAQDTEAWVRRGVAEYPHTPVEVLRTLAQDADREVRSSVAKHLRTPIDILRTLAQDAEEDVYRTVAEHPHLPVEMLRTLAQDESVSVRRAVARNPRTPVDVLIQLCLDPDELVRQAVAEHPHTSEAVLLALLRNTPKKYQYGKAGRVIALHPQASAAILHLLTRYPNREVRWLAHFLQQLLAEVGEAVREQAWWASLRRFFVGRPNWGWIGILAIETQVSEFAGLEMPEAIRQRVIIALATNWHVQPTFSLSAEHDERDAATIFHTRVVFYKHLLAPFLPPMALQKLAHSPHWEVRYLMALHESTSRETRQQLSQDGSRYVRAISGKRCAGKGTENG